jgi:hypothetical protein
LGEERRYVEMLIGALPPRTFEEKQAMKGWDTRGCIVDLLPTQELRVLELLGLCVIQDEPSFWVNLRKSGQERVCLVTAARYIEAIQDYIGGTELPGWLPIGMIQTVHRLSRVVLGIVTSGVEYVKR